MYTQLKLIPFLPFLMCIHYFGTPCIFAFCIYEVLALFASLLLDCSGTMVGILPGPTENLPLFFREGNTYVI